MTPIPLRGNEIAVCAIRDLGVWEAMEAYRAGFAVASAAELAGAGGAAYCVRQAALETAIADRMRIDAVISIHRALAAGASVAELAHVLGTSGTDIVERWRAWAEGQVRLNAQCPGLGIEEREYARVAAGIDAAPSSSHDTGGGCCCRLGTRE